MKLLDTKFTYDGFFFRQIKRDGDLVLLEKRKANHTRPSFEVVVVQHHPAQVVSGREPGARIDAQVRGVGHLGMELCRSGFRHRTLSPAGGRPR